MGAIYRKELQSYFYTPNGYIFLSLFSVIGGFFFVNQVLLGGASSISGVLTSLSAGMIVLTPLLTMRSLGEERRQGTVMLLFTNPVSVSAIVFGKFFAAFTLLLIAIASTFVYPVVMAVYGQPAFLEIAVAYLGFILLGAAMTAIGIFVATITTRVATAGAVTLAGLFLLWTIDAILPGISNPVVYGLLEALSLFSHCAPFHMGILSLPAAVYLVSVCILFLILAGAVLERSRDRRR